MDNPHTIPIRIYYEDTDFSGIVYHARYLHFFERGRTEALRDIGVEHSDLLERDPPLVFAVRKMTTQWIAPARIDDLLTVKTKFTEVRGARVWAAQEIWRDDVRITAADVEIVCMGLNGRPTRTPDDLVQRFISRNDNTVLVDGLE
ncbi:MAG: tol-pal system-associated acyl-CoA thioesterase [Pseudomonadota bacterium]